MDTVRTQVRSLQISHKIWKALETTFEGDVHAKRVIICNCICLFQDAKMIEDESMRSYIGRISEIVVGIKSCQGSKEEDEIVWKILKKFNITIQESGTND